MQEMREVAEIHIVSHSTNLIVHCPEENIVAALVKQLLVALSVSFQQPLQERRRVRVRKPIHPARTDHTAVHAG